MGSIVHKVRSILEDPGQVKPYLRYFVGKSTALARDGRVLELIGYWTQELVDVDIYWYYVKRTTDGPFVLETIYGNQMLLDTRDEGISKELFRAGVRERTETDAFRGALQRLATKLDGRSCSVLEIGANIGYFGLMEADILGQSARIYGVEPVTQNRRTLHTNVFLNGFESQFDISECAIGADDGTQSFYTSRKSNCGRLTDDYRYGDPTGSFQTEVKTLDTFIDEKKIQPETISVIRMDIEGYEGEVFSGLPDEILENTPLILFVEFHPNVMSDDEGQQLVDTLKSHGFDIAAVASDGRPVTINSLDEVLAYDLPVGVVLEK